MKEMISRFLSERLKLGQASQKEYITILPEMLGVASAWLDERPSIRTVNGVGDDLTDLKCSDPLKLDTG